MSGKPFGRAMTDVLLVGPVCLGLPPQVDLLVKLQIRTIITTFSHASSWRIFWSAGAVPAK